MSHAELGESSKLLLKRPLALGIRRHTMLVSLFYEAACCEEIVRMRDNKLAPVRELRALNSACEKLLAKRET